MAESKTNENVVRPRRYAVFLSYRHADNKELGRQWATWLHQMLESYEVPPEFVGTQNGRGEPIPSSLYPVFRDEEELPADADLTRNIRRATREQRFACRSLLAEGCRLAVCCRGDWPFQGIGESGSHSGVDDRRGTKRFR